MTIMAKEPRSMGTSLMHISLSQGVTCGLILTVVCISGLPLRKGVKILESTQRRETKLCFDFVAETALIANQ